MAAKLVLAIRNPAGKTIARALDRRGVVYTRSDWRVGGVLDVSGLTEDSVVLVHPSMGNPDTKARVIRVDSGTALAALDPAILAPFIPVAKARKGPKPALPPKGSDRPPGMEPPVEPSDADLRALVASGCWPRIRRRSRPRHPSR